MTELKVRVLKQINLLSQCMAIVVVMSVLLLLFLGVAIPSITPVEPPCWQDNFYNDSNPTRVGVCFMELYKNAIMARGIFNIQTILIVGHVVFLTFISIAGLAIISRTKTKVRNLSIAKGERTLPGRENRKKIGYRGLMFLIGIMFFVSVAVLIIVLYASTIGPFSMNYCVDEWRSGSLQPSTTVASSAGEISNCFDHIEEYYQSLNDLHKKLGMLSCTVSMFYCLVLVFSMILTVRLKRLINQGEWASTDAPGDTA